jgi:hypothetical protein
MDLSQGALPMSAVPLAASAAALGAGLLLAAAYWTEAHRAPDQP